MSTRFLVALLCMTLTAADCLSQKTTLSGRVQLVRTAESTAKDASGKDASAKDASNVVVWLTPLSTAGAVASAKPVAQSHPRLVQTGKHFEPHLLVVPVGTAVEFPNKDPFFHNVFSLFDGKRFDLGLYEAGSTRTVRFEKAGVSYIFCNIHPQMSAVVVALSTPYFAISNVRGEITIADVPSGRYMLNVWSEGSLPQELNGLSRELNIPATDRSLGTIRLTDRDHLQIVHKNKYGTDYDDPTPTAPGYPQ